MMLAEIHVNEYSVKMAYLRHIVSPLTLVVIQ